MLTNGGKVLGVHYKHDKNDERPESLVCFYDVQGEDHELKGRVMDFARDATNDRSFPIAQWRFAMTAVGFRLFRT